MISLKSVDGAKNLQIKLEKTMLQNLDVFELENLAELYVVHNGEEQMHLTSQKKANLAL